MGKRIYEYLASTLIEGIAATLRGKVSQFEQAAAEQTEVFGQLPGVVRGLRVALSIVEDAAKTEGWIPVTERLPDVPKQRWSSSKLTRWSSGAIRISSFYNASERETWWLDEVAYEPNGHKVTHWQELPGQPSPTTPITEEATPSPTL